MDKEVYYILNRFMQAIIFCRLQINWKYYGNILILTHNMFRISGKQNQRQSNQTLFYVLYKFITPCKL